MSPAGAAKRRPSTTTATDAGTLKKKSQRHDPWVTTHPPATGPMAAVIALNADHVPMAEPRELSG